MDKLKEVLGLNEDQINYLISNPEIKNLLQEKEWIPPSITKKVKIKKADGTFGAAIPYSTDAKYIDVDLAVITNGDLRGTVTLEEVLYRIQNKIDTTLDNIIGGSY